MISPRHFFAARKLYPKKQLGQNFLTDPAFAEMIVARSGILPDDVVLEIGAGLGALTIPLARVAQKIFAVEKDRQIIDILRTEMRVRNISNVELIDHNILSLDINALANDIGRQMVVVGNLPYNISSQILIQLIKARDVLKHAVLMFQKEMAQRITAQPGGKDYGRLAVMLMYCANIKKIADVKAALFFPKPKVDSEVLSIRFRTESSCVAKDEDFLFRVVKAAFSKRRKTMRNALAGSDLNIDRHTAQHVLEQEGIDPIRRAETLHVEEFVRLSNSLDRRFNL
jgi:16S rRNA (adenine1518-N6/adenine1519-N6)-dimethyltransferase